MSGEDEAGRDVPSGFSVRGPLLGQGEAAERILRALPDWFGIEASVLDYVLLLVRPL